MKIVEINLKFSKLLFYWFFGILVWLVDGIALALFVSSFKTISISQMMEVVAIFPTGYVVAFLSILFPGGLGIREGIFAFFLANILGEPLNLVVAGLSRIWIIAMELIVVLPYLVLYFLHKRKDKDERIS